MRWIGLLCLAVFGCGEGVEQAPSCARYTACIRALDEARGIETDLDRFDPGGPCWNSEEGALVCERACTAGLAFEARRSPDPPAECVP